MTCDSRSTITAILGFQGLQPNHHHPLLLVMGDSQVPLKNKEGRGAILDEIPPRGRPSPFVFRFC